MSAPEPTDQYHLNTDPLLSMKQAATYLGISVSKMYELAKREQFSVVKVTSDRKIRRSVLDDYIMKSETPWCWMNLGGHNLRDSL
jgi:excisionase family DNA binding protein